MAAPTKEKTWEYDLNNTTFADGTFVGNAFESTSRRLFLIKEILINNGSTTFTVPWTVTSSSDSSTAGASDLWVDAGDLIWRDDDTSNVFSWIVLRQTGISATFELLITCEEDNAGNDGKQIGVWVAQAGFTGGTTTARPTASDERQLRDSTSSGYWGSGPPGVAYTSQTHVWMSNDGEITRILICIDGEFTGYWAFEKPKNVVTPWTNPYFATVQGDSDVVTSQLTYSKYYDSANMASRFSGIDTSLYMSGEGFASQAAGEAVVDPNQLTDDFAASAIGLHSLTSNFRGRQGEVADLWWGYTDTANRVGLYFPADGSKTFIQIGHLIFPWDGSTILKVV